MPHNVWLRQAGSSQQRACLLRCHYLDKPVPRPPPTAAVLPLHPHPPMLFPTLAKLAITRKCWGASGVRNSRLQPRGAVHQQRNQQVEVKKRLAGNRHPAGTAGDSSPATAQV